MICEPNFSLPQRINLHDLSISDDPETNNDLENVGKDTEAVKHKISYVQDNYRILPKFYDQFSHLNTTLSLRSNENLSCRWNQFLNNVPENYVRIRLYGDYLRYNAKRSVRRKMLNGNFYGVDNKLAPIPQLSDPRKLVTKKKK